MNHFVYFSRSPPIPPEYAGLSVKEGGYEHINFHNRIEAINISSLREYIDESLPPPLQRLISCSLLSLLALIFDLNQLAPLLNNPTFLLDAVLLIKDDIRQKIDDNKKLNVANPNVLAIWLTGIMFTLPSTRFCVEGIVNLLYYII